MDKMSSDDKLAKMRSCRCILRTTILCIANALTSISICKQRILTFCALRIRHLKMLDLQVC